MIVYMKKISFFLMLIMLGFVIHATVVYGFVSYFNDTFHSSISSIVYFVFTFPASLWYYLSCKYDLPGFASLPEFITYSFWGIIYSIIIFKKIYKRSQVKN